MSHGFQKSMHASQKMLRAATKGDTATLEDELLVEYHVDAIDQGGNGRAALHAASEAGQEKCVRWLIERGCDVNIRSTKHQHTALHIAGSSAVARVLLEAGASPAAKDSMRQTPLQRFKSINMSGDKKVRVVAQEIVEVIETWARGNVSALGGGSGRTRAAGSQRSNLPPIRVECKDMNIRSPTSLLGEKSTSRLDSQSPDRPASTNFAPTIHHLQAATRGVEESSELLEKTLSDLRRQRRVAQAKQAVIAEAEREKLVERQREQIDRLSGRLPDIHRKEEHEAWEIDIPESEIQFDECDDFIGAGGQGQVFKATWHRTRVAVKKVAIEDEDDAEELNRQVSGATARDSAAVDKKNINDLKKESRILSGLKHPNILQFLGCHFQYPCYYMVMELVEGPNGKNNLRHIIDDKSIRPSFSLSIRARMLHEISQGCAYLHERDTIHRDLKCSNVLVDQTFRCKIADFGLSRITDQKHAKALKNMGPMAKSVSSVVDGNDRGSHARPKLHRQLTRKYNISAIISPEVMAGQKYDSTVDCFSFGIIIIEMLTFLEPELIPRAKFGLTGKNKHAHLGIGGVDDVALRELLSEEVPEDQPDEAHALVALAERCLKTSPKARPTMGEACDTIASLRKTLPEVTQLPNSV